MKVDLKFDDGSRKERVISNGDIVDIVYNGGGMRKHAQGKVIRISANGTDPNGWYIIVDGSDDFSSDKVRFAPTSILDCEIIRKGDMLDAIQSPLGEQHIPYMRIVKGYLQYSIDGFTWKEFRNCNRRNPEDDIEDVEGTVPQHKPPHKPCPPRDIEDNTTSTSESIDESDSSSESLEIEDSIY